MLEFKDASAPQFGHSCVFFCLFIPPVNHHINCLRNGICGTFELKSNYFGPVMPTKLKKFGKIGEEGNRQSLQNHIYTNGSKTTLLSPNRGAAASLKSKADALDM